MGLGRPFRRLRQLLRSVALRKSGRRWRCLRTGRRGLAGKRFHRCFPTNVYAPPAAINTQPLYNPCNACARRKRMRLPLRCRYIAERAASTLPEPWRFQVKLKVGIDGAAGFLRASSASHARLSSSTPARGRVARQGRQLLPQGCDDDNQTINGWVSPHFPPH